MTFDGDYDAYRRYWEAELATLPRVAAQAVGWGFCEQLFQVVDGIGAAVGQPILARIRGVLDEAWLQVSRGEFATADAAELERLVPTDEAGVGLGGPGVSELSDLGICVALVSEAASAGSDSVARAAISAVSAMADYGDLDNDIAAAQERLMTTFREGHLTSVPDLRGQAAASGRALADRVRGFLGLS